MPFKLDILASALSIVILCDLRKVTPVTSLENETSDSVHDRASYLGFNS